jgi:hypothetical protein
MKADSKISDKPNQENGHRASAQRKRVRWSRLGLALALAIIGFVWIAWARSIQPPAHQQLPALPADNLTPGAITGMDSPLFEYGPGWTINAAGADPGEPTNPQQEPSGIVEFAYEGNELALQLATGDYWGYLYVTVDGAPASELPAIRGNDGSQGHPAGYKPLYDPDNLTDDAEPTPVWIQVHSAADVTKSHKVRVEVWRSWGQKPLRAVAVDALPPKSQPNWPGVALLVAAFWLAVAGLWDFVGQVFDTHEAGMKDRQPGLLDNALSLIGRFAIALAGLGLGSAVLGTGCQPLVHLFGRYGIVGSGCVGSSGALDRSTALRPALLLRLSAAAAAGPQL